MSIYLGDKNVGVELIAPHGRDFYDKIELIQSIVRNHNAKAENPAAKIKSIFEKYTINRAAGPDKEKMIFQVFAYLPETEEFVLIEPFHHFLIKIPSKFCILTKHNFDNAKEGKYWLKLK